MSSIGHFQYECPKWEKEANYVELEEKEEMLLMSYVELNQSREKMFGSLTQV